MACEMAGCMVVELPWGNPITPTPVHQILMADGCPDFQHLRNELFKLDVSDPRDQPQSNLRQKHSSFSDYARAVHMVAARAAGMEGPHGQTVRGEWILSEEGQLRATARLPTVVL
eukprot:TRINITY_DN56022_c0_g2_i1.p2 TRINITY_DN56022_c0_g2~~TRINITY_DN56022_c0_g2_i1.p2  ORF type:complete len:115 (+),score=11.20 TRINITY_DN56022_c0_g2_i1:191-535(+)